MATSVKPCCPGCGNNETWGAVILTLNEYAKLGIDVNYHDWTKPFRLCLACIFKARLK